MHLPNISHINRNLNVSALSQSMLVHGNVFLTQNLDTEQNAEDQKHKKKKHHKDPNPINATMMNLLNLTKNFCDKFEQKGHKARRRNFDITMESLVK